MNFSNKQNVDNFMIVAQRVRDSFNAKYKEVFSDPGNVDPYLDEEDKPEKTWNDVTD